MARTDPPSSARRRIPQEPPRRGASAARNASLTAARIRSFLDSLGCASADAGPAGRQRLGFLRLVEKELTDQLLEDHRRLRLRDPVAVLEHGWIAARVETDVDLAQHAGRVDRGDRVLRELILTLDSQGGHRLVGLRI